MTMDKELAKARAEGFEAGRRVGFGEGIKAAATEVRKRYAERKTRPEWAERMAGEVEALALMRGS